MTGMTHDPSLSADPMTSEPPSSPYAAPPPQPPTAPSTFTPPAQPAPTAPPVPVRRTWRDRTAALRSRVVKLWAVLAVGAACLVVGLGVGALIGHASGGSGSADLQQPPGIGTGRLPGQ